MQLVKNVGSTYHPVRCKTLQLGTLDHYRKTEELDLQDPYEGVRNTTLKDCILNKQDATDILGPIFEFEGTQSQDVFGTCSFHSQEGCSISTSEASVAITGTGILEYKQNEAYLFCMSIDDGDFVWPHDTKDIRDWSIDGDQRNVKKFSEQLRYVVLREIRQLAFKTQLAKMNGYSLEQLSGNRLRVISRWAKVEYRKRITELTGDLRFVGLQKQFLYSFSSFVKDPIPKFTAEQEFRFCYYPMLKLGPRNFVSLKHLPEFIRPKNGSLRKFMSWNNNA